MAKSNTPKTSAQTSATALPGPALPAFLENVRLNGWLFFTLGFLLYIAAVGHGFVLDDSMLIYKNHATKQGLQGIPAIFTTDVSLGNMEVGQQSGDVVAGGRYRPLSIAVFAVIYQIFGQKPGPYHFMTVLFYALCCLVFYRSMAIVLKNTANGKAVAWLAAALFTLHPIHTEVVNNNKATDEIFALMFSLMGLVFTLEAYRNGRLQGLIWAFLSFLAAVFSKENAVMFVAIVPIAVWAFGKTDDRPERPRMVDLLKYTAPILGASAIFLAVRGAVLGWSVGEAKLNLINNAFVKLEGGTWVHYSWAEKYATISYTLGKYFLLHVFPHPLSADYYPYAIPAQHFSSPAVLASIGLYLLMIYFGVRGLGQRVHRAFTFGILFYLITLFIVSNIPVSLGTNMAERFAFMPSAGLCLSFASLIVGLLYQKPQWRTGIFASLGIVFLLFALKTVTRSADYTDNKTLFAADALVVPQSARVHYGLGGMLLKEALPKDIDAGQKQVSLSGAIAEFDKAIAIHPTYSECYYARGSANFLSKNYILAIADFEKSLAITPNRPEIKNNYAIALREAAKQEAEKGASADHHAILQFLKESDKNGGGQDKETIGMLGQAYCHVGDFKGAVPYFEKMLLLMPGNAQVIQVLAETYEKAGDPARAAEVRKTGK